MPRKTKKEVITTFCCWRLQKVPGLPSRKTTTSIPLPRNLYHNFHIFKVAAQRRLFITSQCCGSTLEPDMLFHSRTCPERPLFGGQSPIYKFRCGLRPNRLHDYILLSAFPARMPSAVRQRSNFLGVEGSRFAGGKFREL
jgi:hypothetical protein